MAKSFGERFRELRCLEPKKTQKEVAKRLHFENAAPVSLIEKMETVPKVETIIRYAAALGCKPSELLEGVETDYDLLRAGKYDNASKDFAMVRERRKGIKRAVAR